MPGSRSCRSSRLPRWQWLVGAVVGWLTTSPTIAHAGPHAPPQPAAVQWAPQVFSPRPGPAASSIDEPLRAICGKPDTTLAHLAGKNAEHQLSTGKPLESDALAFHLRTVGAPYMWPRAWSIKGSALDGGDLASRVTAWTDRNKVLGERRCGVARRSHDGVTIVSAISIDALADLDPLPVTTRVGQWLNLRGTLLVPASSVHVVLLGPRGAPKKVLASLDGDRIRSTFSVDQPGAWLVQVLADTVSAGPRPVLQTIVHAGSKPPSHFVRAPAPGEEVRSQHSDDDQALAAMMNAARQEEGIPQLKRDAALDRVALAHSQAMQRRRLVAHDVGNGSPLDRIHGASIQVQLAGENVASAGTLVKAHRAIWSSPSHRGNLLDRRFKRMGVAVVRDADGRVWATQMLSN